MESGVETIQKSPTGIKGLDEVIHGGLPEGRVSLVCGGPGCGKTLLAAEFLVRGAVEYGEPGVFMTFEETEDDLTRNVASLGIDLAELVAQEKLYIDNVYIERSEIEETGDYDLSGLFIRLALAIDSIGAKRVVLDTIEAIFAGLSNEAILRSEIRRLFRWLKEKGVTTIVTGERGEKSLTRYGLEEYVSDCVILLDNRVENKISNRILRVVKYRGSSHGTDEYPFLISDDGLWVQPVTSATLDYPVSSEFVSTGIPELDLMFGGRGFYRAGTVLISGSAGTGKTSLAASMVDAACRRGERCLYFAFEEAPAQIVRNMGSIGMDLQQWVDRGMLHFHANRPYYFGIETHLLSIQRRVEMFRPDLVVIDPLSNLTSVASVSEVKSMLVRVIDYLKLHRVTAIFTSLTATGRDEPENEVGVSSLMDTWILLRNLEDNGERNRALFILKSRGMAHSSQVREFILTSEGIRLVDVAVGADGVLVGSARQAFQAREENLALQRQTEVERKRRELDRKRSMIQRQIDNLQAELESHEEQLAVELDQAEEITRQEYQTRRTVKRSRQDGGPEEGTENSQ